MLSGYPPFYGENDMEVFQKILNFEYDFDDEVWENTSAEAKDLVTKLMSPVKTRISAKDALKHPWLVRHTRASREVKFDGDILKKMANYTNVSKMGQIALNCIAHLCGTEEILESKNFFSSLDLNNDGYITLKEL
jgi:serine/threonine protein kinase